MTSRWRPTTTFVLLSLIVATVGAVGAPQPPSLHLLVLGDSLSAALDPELSADNPRRSWATGELDEGASVVQRLREAGWRGSYTNVARSGDRSDHLQDQLSRAPRQADLVLVWIGTNDLCQSHVHVQDFRANLDMAFTRLTQEHPAARVLVFAPPSLLEIAQQQREIPQAQAMWGDSDACAPYLARNQSEQQAQARYDAFEAALQASALEHGFAYSEALQSMERPLADWTIEDYLHPSENGSALIAAQAWPDVRRVLPEVR